MVPSDTALKKLSSTNLWKTTDLKIAVLVIKWNENIYIYPVYSKYIISLWPPYVTISRLIMEVKFQ